VQYGLQLYRKELQREMGKHQQALQKVSGKCGEKAI
jgi:hypothetical protein